ncbi:hypothetical protein [Oceanicaulis sp.]|uniref:hypothetical protein n=1 Tax=Oceanicaulis sp. TaxID=1924941 RepID=UPI003D27D561
MADMTTRPEHRFTVLGALGFGLEVWRSRPAPTTFLVVLQALFYLAMTGLQMGLLGASARQGVQALEAGDTAGLFMASLNSSGYSSLLMLVSYPLILWLETVALVLFMSGRFSLWPGWASLGRLTLSALIIFAVYMAAIIVLSIFGVIIAITLIVMAESTGDSGLAIGMGAGLGAVGFLGLVALVSLFTALPGRAVTGALDMSGSISIARAHWLRLILVWVLAMGLYLVVMIVGYGLVWAVHSELIRAAWESLLAAPQDPYVSLYMYEALLPRAETALWLVLSMAPVMVMMCVVMMVWRGIVAKLALSMPNPSEKAP